MFISGNLYLKSIYIFTTFNLIYDNSRSLKYMVVNKGKENGRKCKHYKMELKRMNKEMDEDLYLK